MSASHPFGRRSRARLLGVAVFSYAGAVGALWLSVELLVDRVWPATLFGFGPRWIAAAPLAPLGAWAIAFARRDGRWLNVAVVCVTAVALLFGVMGLNLRYGNATTTADIRVLTHNLGASRVTAKALDRLLRDERIDVAALQECPFYDLAPARLGWQFFYGGDLCLVSRFPFTVLDLADPETAWEHNGFEPLRFEIHSPAGTFELLNVHLETIREAIEGLPEGGWRARFAANRAEARRESLHARDRLRAASHPFIVAGDFNLPVESAIYREAWGDLLNTFTACGRGFGHTKFTRLFGVRIDHVLASHHWRCTNAYVLTSPYGGDHAPVVAALTLR